MKIRYISVKYGHIKIDMEDTIVHFIFITFNLNIIHKIDFQFNFLMKIHCLKKPEGWQNSAVNWKFGQFLRSDFLKAELSWEAHIHTYTHMQKLLAKKSFR